MYDKKKLVICGNENCGKSSLMTVFQKGVLSSEYDEYQEIENTFTKIVEIDGLVVELEVWNQREHEYQPLRKLYYPLTDVFVLCYSIDNPRSLQDIRDTWVPEIRGCCPNVPFILVGNKNDNRMDDKKDEVCCQKTVSVEEGQSTANAIGSFAFMECSARTNEGIKEVFDVALRIAIKTGQNKSKKSSCILF